MRQCQACSGLVPEALDACPNCLVTERRTGLRSIAMRGLVALAVSSCGGTQMALYGAPCTVQNGCIDCTTLRPDGGSPKKDPSSPCYSPDGGTP